MVDAIKESAEMDPSMSSQMEELSHIWERVNHLSSVREARLQEAFKLVSSCGIVPRGAFRVQNSVNIIILKTQSKSLPRSLNNNLFTSTHLQMYTFIYSEEISVTCIYCLFHLFHTFSNVRSTVY